MINGIEHEVCTVCGQGRRPSIPELVAKLKAERLAELKGSGGAAPVEEEKVDTPHVNMTRLKFLSFDLERIVRIE